MLELDCFARAFMKQPLATAWMKKELTRGGLKPPGVVLIYANVWLRIKVCFLVAWLVLKTLDSLPSSNFYLNRVAFLELPGSSLEKKIVLEVSSTVTSINHVTWPTAEIHVSCFEMWPMSQILGDLNPPSVSYFLKKIKLKDVYQKFTIELF